MNQIMPIGANAQEIKAEQQAAKVFKFNLAADVIRGIVNHPKFLDAQRPCMTSTEVAEYAFEVAEYAYNEALGKGNDSSLVH